MHLAWCESWDRRLRLQTNLSYARIHITEDSAQPENVGTSGQTEDVLVYFKYSLLWNVSEEGAVQPMHATPGQAGRVLSGTAMIILQKIVRTNEDGN